jgi:large subunit ribosomal protein L6e
LSALGSVSLLFASPTLSLLFSPGPYTCNGVPLRRVNQKYVIATSTSVNVSGVDVSKIDDAFFAREKKVVKKSEEALFDNSKKPTETSDVRKAAQSAVDAVLNKEIRKTKMLSAYLSSRFTLSNSDKPHAMKF